MEIYSMAFEADLIPEIKKQSLLCPKFTALTPSDEAVIADMHPSVLFAQELCAGA